MAKRILTEEQRLARNAYMRNYYAEHPDQFAASHKNYVAKNRPAVQAKTKLRLEKRAADPLLAEQDREYKRRQRAKWFANNKDKAHESTNTYAAHHKDAINARRRLRYAENSTKPLANNRKRRALKRGAKKSDLTAAQWEGIKDAYGQRCVYCPPDCWRCARGKHKLTQDHITPLSQGGDHTVNNVVPACQACNAKKFTGPVLQPVQLLLLL